jgi:hypothetical protein
MHAKIAHLGRIGRQDWQIDLSEQTTVHRFGSKLDFARSSGGKKCTAFGKQCDATSPQILRLLV